MVCCFLCWQRNLPLEYPACTLTIVRPLQNEVLGRLCSPILGTGHSYAAWGWKGEERMKGWQLLAVGLQS